MLILVALAACDRSTKTSESKTPEPGGAVASDKCDELDRDECLASETCVLDARDPTTSRYVCRPEQGPCETGLAQLDAQACSARAGCRYEKPDCYCSCRGAGRTKVEDRHGERCNCGCGGGPPGRCVPAAPDCEALDRHECMQSEACTLELVATNQYRCRPERGPCETGLAQADEKACTARAACKFVPATCYCPCRGYGRTKVEDTHGPQCKCDCAGDAPPACLVK